MDAHPAYLLGSACADTRQAARLLRRRFAADGESAAWFVLGFWHLRRPDAVRELSNAVAEQSARNGEPIGMILRRRTADVDDTTPTRLKHRDYGDLLYVDARLDVTARVIQFFQSWGPAQPKDK